MKKTALVLTPRLPWPLDDGGRIGLYQTVWSAAQDYDVTVLALVASGTEKDPLPNELTDLGVRVVRVPHTPPPMPVAALQGLFGRWPYTLARYRNEQYDLQLRRIIQEIQPSFALVNHLHMATYVDALGDVPMVLREHNLEFLWMDRYSKRLPHGPRRTYAQMQVRRLRRTEKELCSQSAVVLAIQELEVQLIRELAPETRVELLPMGIDPGRFRFPDLTRPKTVLLCGNFGWPPNEDGAIRFLERGWPKVLERLPGTRLRMAGKEPAPHLRAMAEKLGAEVPGYVESMEKEFTDSSVLAVPLWSGAGARVKIIEACLSRLPVVSTPIGAEGLGLEAGNHYLESDEPEGLADHIIRLLESPECLDGFAARALEFGQKTWALPTVARIQNAFCGEVALS